MDPLLLPYLQARDEDEASRLLGDLLSRHVEPIIRGVVALRTRTGAGARAVAARREDAEDLRGQTMVQLLARLRGLRDGSETAAAPIADLRGYAAVLAFHTCHAWLRRLFPRRASLKNRLRYLIAHDARFLIRPAAGRGFRCGLAGRDVATLDSTEALDDMAGASNAPAEVEVPVAGPRKEATRATRSAGRSADDPSAGELADLVIELLEGAGRPLELEALVDTVARRRGLEEAPAHRSLGPGDLDRLVGDRPRGDATLAEALDRRAALERLWDEVVVLPLAQRSALLLNLRDENGRGLIRLLPLTGVTSMRGIAAALEMTPERLAGLWGDLPIDDAAIAARMGLSRQQVINLRKSARERLARRLSKNAKITPASSSSEAEED